jgi:hypothetical protein
MAVTRIDLLDRLRCAPFLLVLVTASFLAVCADGAAADLDTAEDAVPFEVIGRLGGLTTALAAHGEHLYLGIGSRLVVLDADAQSGLPNGGSESVNLPHTIADAAVLSPGLVAVLAGDAVFIVDVAIPHATEVVATYAQYAPLRALEARQGICFLLGDQAVYIVDASSPKEPRDLATIDLPQPATRNTQLLVGDGVLFVGGGLGAVLVYDVGHADAPLLIGGVEDGIEVSKMAASGRTLYVTHRADMFDDDGDRLVGTIVYVLEVDPNNELLKHGFVALIPPMVAPPDFHTVDIAADGTHIYVAGSEILPDGYTMIAQIR